MKLILFIFFAFLQIAALLIHIFLLKETNSDNVPKKVTLLETVNVDDVDQPKEIDDNNTQSKTSWVSYLDSKIEQFLVTWVCTKLLKR